MADPLAVKSSNPVLAWATAIGVIGLALSGFVLSFDALRDLAVHSGIVPELAFIWPLIVDGFIVVATAAAFALKRRGPVVTWYPWAALVLFSAISVVGNASHAIEAPEVTIPIWAATMVSSVPAVALLIASHLLVVMIDGNTRPARTTAAAARPRPSQGTELGKTRAARAPQSPQAQVNAAPLQLHAVEPAERCAGLPERLVAVIADGAEITGSLVAKLDGVSERTGRRRVEKLRETHPYLFDSEPREVAQ